MTKQSLHGQRQKPSECQAFGLCVEQEAGLDPLVPHSCSSVCTWGSLRTSLGVQGAAFPSPGETF